MLGIAFLLGFVFVMCYVGPDYINPTECMFGGGTCGYVAVNGDGATEQFIYRRKRAIEHVTSAIASSSHIFYKGRIARYGWSPLTDPLLSGPNYTIDKNWWASANRVGLIGYALLPLSVALALKQWPMNIFATPFFTNIHIDKTAFWHRWIGRIVWIISTVHAALWTKQLYIDISPFDEPTWNVAWKWHRLVAGGIVSSLHLYYNLLSLLSLPFNNSPFSVLCRSHSHGSTLLQASQKPILRALLLFACLACPHLLGYNYHSLPSSTRMGSTCSMFMGFRASCPIQYLDVVKPRKRDTSFR
jgi:hypothetical protein